MKHAVVISDKYHMRAYSKNAILFSKTGNCSDRILNPFESEILNCVDGKKGMEELMHMLCEIYSIPDTGGTNQQYQILKNYVNQFFEQGILKLEEV